MHLECKKSVIELLKEFNRYYFIKHKRLTNSAVNRTDNLYSLDANYWSKDKLADYITEGKLYELLKTEFKDEISYSPIDITYEPSHTNLSIGISYPYGSDKTKLWLIILDATKPDVAREDFDNIKNLTDIVDILKQVRDKYDN